MKNRFSKEDVIVDRRHVELMLIVWTLWSTWMCPKTMRRTCTGLGVLVALVSLEVLINYPSLKKQQFFSRLFVFFYWDWFSLPVSICLSFVSVAVWGKAGCVYSLFCESVFVCFDVALGFFGVGGGACIWDMHTLHVILCDIVVNCRMCVCICISVDSLFHKCSQMKPKGGKSESV